MRKTAADAALTFVDFINCHDVRNLCAMITDDFLFVDGLGQEIRGPREIERGWKAYFTWFPDYSIQVDDSFNIGGTSAGLFGYAHGTFAVDGQLLPENRWRIPAAWKARVRDGHISEWRVYADNEPVWKIMRMKRY
jgi:ketosteroid isomerase-like protein